MSRLGFNGFMMLVLMVCWGTPRAAHAETYHTCTGFITSIPTVISTQGTWCMKQDLATAISSGSAITIATNNVTIDCNNFKLGGLAAGLGTLAWGISATDRLNATVRNCNIRGFEYGIVFQGSGSGGHAIEDNRFDGSTDTGIYVTGDGSVVRRNRIFDTGGSTVFPDTWGIYTSNSVDILDNTISGVAATVGSNGTAIGIQTNSDTDSSVSGNRIRGLLHAGSGGAVGIENLGDVRISMRNNDLVGDGDLSSYGLLCDSTVSSAQGNVISAFQTAVFACSNDGGNVTHP
jgi:parallel beta-helix repeat protein